MTVGLLINRDCTILRRSDSGQTDNYGNAIETDAVIDTYCEIQQARRSERDDSGEVSDDTWTIFFAAGEDVTTGDAVQVDGHVFELTGEPWEVRNPRTQTVSHIESTARRTAGAEDVS